MSSCSSPQLSFPHIPMCELDKQQAISEAKVASQCAMLTNFNFLCACMLLDRWTQ